MGVAKPGASGVRYADVFVVEGGSLSGPPRVETFTFKSRDFSLLAVDALMGQMIADASAALPYYGERLNIRRPSLHLRDSQVLVHRVRLIYEGGALKPERAGDLNRAMREAEKTVQGVEVLFEMPRVPTKVCNVRP